MDMMSYLLGKSVGNDESKIASTRKIRQLNSDAWSWRNRAEELEAENEQLHQRLDLVTKRFLREREKRNGWQKAAIFRQLMLTDRGVTKEEISAEQHRMAQTPEIDDKVIDQLVEERKKIDREFGIF